MRMHVPRRLKLCPALGVGERVQCRGGSIAIVRVTARMERVLR